MKFILVVMFLFLNLYANSPKEILLLHSYNKGLRWTDGISKGVESVFDNKAQYELTTEYMDTKKIDSKEYFKLLYNLYKKKFEKRDYQAIITADNYAFDFALKHHKDLFHQVPIVFCGVENFDKINIPLYLQKDVTGVIEYKEITKNIKLVQTMIPNINTLYIISDNAYSSREIQNQILQAMKPFQKEFKIIYDNDIDLKMLLYKINSLPKNSAVLFTSLYKDRYGKYIPYNQIRKLFADSKYPVFAVNKIHLAQGVVGGVMINPFDQGVLAAKKVIEILNGKIPLQIEVSKPTTQTYFDRKILDKYKMNRKNIPIGATVINNPKDFFEKNRNIIDSSFVIMPLLLLLIIGLIINISKRISLEVRMSEQNKLDNVLLNNVKNAIFWKGNDGVLLGCNEYFCTMLGTKRGETIGRKLIEIVPEICQIFKNEENFTGEIETILYNTAKGPMNVLIRRNQYFNKNNEQAGIVTVIHDVTELKKLQEDRKKEEQFLVQRSKLSEIGEMITSIAHQWKNPLVEISSIAQELMYKQKRAIISQSDTQRFVDDIMEQVEYMTSTIDDFRAFIKPSTQKSNFSIEEAIKGLIKVIHNSLKYNYINLEVKCKIEKFETIYGYPNEFKQSILNIINNAKDSIIKRRQKQEIEGKITINVYELNNSTCIEIVDNGVGIPTKHLENIFKPFFTSKKDGDGFGLYMTKFLIEDKMGGYIQALEVKEGALIRISLMHKRSTNEGIASGR